MMATMSPHKNWSLRGKKKTATVQRQVNLPGAKEVEAAGGKIWAGKAATAAGERMKTGWKAVI